MSNLLRPVGPLPPRVYWARRLVVLVVAILVVVLTAVLVVKVINRGSDAGPGAAASTTGSASESKDASGAPVDCTKDDIGLTLTASGTTFAEGQQPTFSVQVNNVGEVPCLVDVNPKELSVDVVSGQDEIWSSALCVKGKPELLLLGGDDVHTVPTQWERVRNSKDCSKKTVDAKPGTYRASASLRGAKSAEVVFTLN